MDVMKQFRIDRDDAFTAAVMQDDWDAVRRYCKKYRVQIPNNEDVLKAGIYKAVLGIVDMPQEVKDTARKKCVSLGFKPTIWG